jgi:hypothetical protein
VGVEPPAPPPPTTVTLIALTVAGLVQVPEVVYTFITGTPVAAAVVSDVVSGNVIPVGPIIVAIFYLL